MSGEWVFNVYVLVLASFVGYQVISRVPPLLHTPLMSGTNAISGISLVASLQAAGSHHQLSQILGFFAVTCATINVVGGFLITQLRQHFRDRAAKAARYLMLLYGNDRADFFASSTIFLSSMGLIVEQFKTIAPIFSFQRTGGKKRVIKQAAAADDQNLRLFPLPEYLRLAGDEWRLVRRHDRRLLALESQIDRAPHLRRGDRSFARLHGVARNKDFHVRQSAHRRDVFRRLVRRAIGTDEMPA